MPVLTLRLRDGLPEIGVVVTASGSRLQILGKEGKPLPELKEARALVDTGASSTCVDLRLVMALELEPQGSTFITTPSSGQGPVVAETYKVGLIIASGTEDRLIFPALRVVGIDLSAQGTQVLLGRDILSRCLLLYDGKHQSMTLAY